MGRSQRHKVYVQGYAIDDKIRAEGMIAGSGSSVRNPPSSLWPYPAGATKPTVSGLSPATAVKGGADLTMTVTGTNFVSGLTRINFNGGIENTTFISVTQVSTVVKPSLVSVSGAYPVCVENGPFKSNAISFTFTDT